MLSEVAVVLDLDDVVGVIWVLILQVLQYVQLDTCLVLIPFLVLDDLDGDNLPSLVVQALQSLTKRSLTKEVDHLKSKAEMVMQHHLVVSVLVVIAIVVVPAGRLAMHFVLQRLVPNIVNLAVVQQLSLLIIR